MATPGRLVGLAVVGNEADIVEAFVRHTLRFVDELVVVVHRPDDGTDAILEGLRAEGLPLRLLPARLPGFQQAGESVPIAKALLGGGEAGFVLPLDADEFLRMPDPGYLRRALPALPPGKFGAWRWQGYVPLPGDDAAEANPLRRIRNRRRDEGIDCFKIALTPAFAGDGHFLLEGNHCVMRGAMQGQPVSAPMVELKAVRLAHFPVRSAGQLAAKVTRGEQAKQAAGKADPAHGAHWRRLAEGVARGERLGPEDLRRIAVRYPFPDDARLDVPDTGLVEDPVPADFALRYTPPPRRGRLP